jgi:predicted enzyme related to lactoylglutathione lyase
MAHARLSLIEFPADDPARARRFWEGLLGEPLDQRAGHEGAGHQTRHADPSRPAVGVHERGRGPGDTRSLPYFAVPDMDAALERVRELGGGVVHAGEAWSVCRDSEGTPFALAAERT